MAEHIDHEDSFENEGQIEQVAVIALEARFPGSENVARYWHNLRHGFCAVTRLSDEDLAGVDEEVLNHPDFVRYGVILEGIELFDALFFGISPLEASAMDPQQRIFLEACWRLMESAGYNPEDEERRVGIYAGAGAPLYSNRFGDGSSTGLDGLQLLIGNSADHLTPRVSYFLNLKGPSVPIQTACSTGLVAVHIAAQSLLSFETDLCIAGAVSLPFPMRSGYIYRESSIMSPDGYCRPFDVDAKGTVRGAGLGAVLLKRLSNALEDNDTIHAVILGSAINNDGSDKVGYTAPSVEGQRRVIREALEMADLSGDDVGMLEAHGTATPLGDPIEVEALIQAYETERVGFCALGSAKSNIGHADAAAGMAGFIKAVLCVEHGRLVPSLHYKEANPKIPMATSPFYVNTEDKAWTAEKRIAGVSSFGIGGTNAHVIISNGPAPRPTQASNGPVLITLSGKTDVGMVDRRNHLKAHLEENRDISLDDVAFTFNTGRKQMVYREAFVGSSIDGLIEKMVPALKISAPVALGQEVVFLFPGQGTDYPDLGTDLYQKQRIFREAADQCSEILLPYLGVNLSEYMFAPEGHSHREELKEPNLWQPALFVAGYAGACLYQAWGIKPAAMMGHSIGEYVAATLAGVLQLEDALQLVAHRGKATLDLERGSMLAVHLSVEGLKPFLIGDLSIAAINGPALTVVSGATSAIEELNAKLSQSTVRTSLLPATHAFHSSHMDPIMAGLTRLASTFLLGPQTIPFISNVTGTWISEDELNDATYWSRHLRGTVQFEPGLRTLFEEEGRVFLEVGPGNTLGNLTKYHPEHNGANATTISPEKGPWDQAAAFQVLGQAWSKGAQIDWSLFYEGQERRRLHLPTYHFQRTPFWIAENQNRGGKDPLENKEKPANWFYLPYWKPAPSLTAINPAELMKESATWMILLDPEGVGEAMAARLESLGQKTLRLSLGQSFEQHGPDRYSYRADAVSDLDSALSAAISADLKPSYLVFPTDTHLNERSHPSARLLRITHALFTRGLPCRILVLTKGVQSVLPGEVCAAESAGILGVARTIPKEIPDVDVNLVDLPAEGVPSTRVLDQIICDHLHKPEGVALAYRHGLRYVEAYSQLPQGGTPDAWPLAQVDTIVVFNGLQELGFALAEYLVAHTHAAILLADKRFFPAPGEWETWIKDEGPDNLTSRHIAKLQQLPADRVKVATVDSGRQEDLARFMEGQSGSLGAFSLAPILAPGTIHSLPMDRPLTGYDIRLAELLSLERNFKGAFLVITSDNEGEGGLGYSAQSAGFNASEAVARRLALGSVPTWCLQLGTREWEEPSEDGGNDPLKDQLREKRQRFGMSFQQCFASMAQVLASEVRNVIVSTRDYEAVLKQTRAFTATFFKEQLQNRDGAFVQNRPQLATDYEAPVGATEAAIAELWAYYFGINQVGRNDDFFELGGHSLLAVQVINKINEQFNTNMNLQQLFETSTPSTLAAHIDGQASLDDDEMAALLAEIEGLSEEETKRAIEEGGN